MLKNLKKKLEIKTGDELQTLAENFNTMTDELKTQMSNLKKVTADKERIATELDVATKIQSSMLPKNFSVETLNFLQFPLRKSFRRKIF